MNFFIALDDWWRSSAGGGGNGADSAPGSRRGGAPGAGAGETAVSMWAERRARVVWNPSSPRNNLRNQLTKGSSGFQAALGRRTSFERSGIWSAVRGSPRVRRGTNDF